MMRDRLQRRFRTTGRRTAGTPDAGRRDAGHEAVGQALLISIGVGAIVVAGRLADVAMSGITVVVAALR